LAVRKHGEAAVIVEVFTEYHGKHAGVVRGGAGRKQAPMLQPGGQFEVVWKARLEEHMGAFTVEPLRSRAAQVMADPLALAGLTSVVGLLSFALPEREVHGALYSASINLLDLICVTEAWPLAYLHWEMQLLEDLGFGLDLSCCAVSGRLRIWLMCRQIRPGCGGTSCGALEDTAVATGAVYDRAKCGG